MEPFNDTIALDRARGSVIVPGRKTCGMPRPSLLLTALPLLALARTASPPVRIVGNLYYVGDTDLAAFLVVTPKGDILIRVLNTPQTRFAAG